VAIARAVVNHPPLVLADEPTGCLDSATGRGIIRLFANLQRDGLTILMVTHDATVAAAADRIVRLADGAVAAA
jgi:putative ABC transport system ATP-binding protein